MTEKRFIWDGDILFDGKDNVELGNCLEARDICDLLNEQDEEIKELSDTLDNMVDFKNKYRDKYKQLKKENRQLKSSNMEYEDALARLEEKNEQLKQTMQEVAELLSEEVDLFSDKATEHDINAYMELKQLDNKDAYYMAVSTKKAIKMLKGDVE